MLKSNENIKCNQMLLHVFIKYVKPNNIKRLVSIFSLHDSFSLVRLGKLHSLPYRLYSLPQGPSTCSNLWSLTLEIFKKFALPAQGGCSVEVLSREKWQPTCSIHNRTSWSFFCFRNSLLWCNANQVLQDASQLAFGLQNKVSLSINTEAGHLVDDYGYALAI